MFGEINRSTFLAATSIEMLHSASLIHDDVVDESYERRGKFSINALWKNKIAVLMGDYLLAKGLLIATQDKEYEVLDIISAAVKDMVEGELLQFTKSRKLDIDEETYYEIIRKKTASLIGISMAVGVHSVIDDAQTIEKMKEIGVLAGLAFQIKDDIFDYQEKGIIGKPTGNDIKEKKITLPLIYVLNQSTGAERQRIINIVKHKNNRKEKVAELIELVRQKGGLEYATQKMNYYCDEAIKKLEEFPANSANESLAKLIKYLIIRKK
jgi:octaprenyl-diphosphate synthase